MKHKIILLAIIICQTGFLWAQGNDVNVALSDPAKRGVLKVELKKGPITIKGVNRQDVLVRYESLEGGETKITDVGNGMKKISGGTAGLEITEQSNKVYVESENWNKGLKLYLEVPRNFDLDVQSYNQGNIEIENIAGKVAIETYNGRITATDIEGSVVANTYNGPIKVTFTKVSGDTPMTFVTYNGNVDITMPADTKANFKMKSQRGDIYTDFDMQVTKGNPPLKKEGDKMHKTIIDEWVNGTINGGGSEFSMQNWNGDIYIRKK